jgi:hypothetical protein
MPELYRLDEPIMVTGRSTTIRDPGRIMKLYRFPAPPPEAPSLDQPVASQYAVSHPPVLQRPRPRYGLRQGHRRSLWRDHVHDGCGLTNAIRRPRAPP